VIVITVGAGSKGGRRGGSSQRGNINGSQGARGQ